MQRFPARRASNSRRRNHTNSGQCAGNHAGRWFLVEGSKVALPLKVQAR